MSRKDSKRNKDTNMVKVEIKAFREEFFLIIPSLNKFVFTVLENIGDIRINPRKID